MGISTRSIQPAGCVTTLLLLAPLAPRAIIAAFPYKAVPVSPETRRMSTPYNLGYYLEY
jgi:hypothetical protein